LGHLGFERLEALLHRLQIMALPHPAHARRREGVPLFAHLVGDPDLAEGGLLQREREDGGLDLGRRAVRQQGLTTGQLLKGELAAGVVELLEAGEAVARGAHHLAGLAHVAELLGELQKAHFGPDDLLLLGHGRGPLKRRGWALRTPTAPRPASALA
jgi:hypothetical protein